VSFGETGFEHPAPYRAPSTEHLKVFVDRTPPERYLVPVKKLIGGLGLVLIAAMGTPSHVSGQSAGGNLVLFGDIVYFYPPGQPKNCLLNNQFKRGEPVGFRMNAINAASGKRDRATELVVHLTYAGKTLDLPMRDRQNERQPEREFWVAKWVVPDDAPMGVVRYTVTAKDPQGRTGEFKPFEVQASQLTIVP
jgi:hypothetical protein